MKRLKSYSIRIVSNFSRILKNRIFFYSVLRYLQADELKKYLKLPLYYKKHTPLHALSKLKFRKRTPHFALLFNQNNIKPFLLYNEIENKNIFTDGVPFYDKYYHGKQTFGAHVVFIEHPYLEEGILNWNPQFHEFIARSLENFAKDRQVKLIVKLHPRSDIRNWLRYNLNEQFITIKQKEDITQELLSAKMVLGYSSTLMNVLIACKKNVVLLGWHPQPIIFGDDFSKTGLCYVSFSVSDLIEKYDYWVSNNLAIKNEVAFNQFLEEYNYPFDGKATERVIKAIKISDRWKIGVILDQHPTSKDFAGYAVSQFNELVNQLSKLKDVEVSYPVIPEIMKQAHEIQEKIYHKALSYYFKKEFANHTLISEVMYDIVNEGNNINTLEYQSAIEKQNDLRHQVNEMFDDIDIIITLSTAATAPDFKTAIDPPDTCLIWTMCGCPSVNVPSFKKDGMPFGLQVISQKYTDYKLVAFIKEIIHLGLFPEFSVIK
jgi:hypothetical protein